MDAAKVLREFLPDRLFDAHAHLFDSAFLPEQCAQGKAAARYELEDYRRDMARLVGDTRKIRLNIIPYPDASMADPESGTLRQTDLFVRQELEKDPANTGELMVTPQEDLEHISNRLQGRQLRGFKCYHTLCSVRDTFRLDIAQYLPESAWELADRMHMAITLHMVKDTALADEENLRYIRRMAKKYPNAVLILAHAARAFAAWTGVESIPKVADLENVWFDLAAVCESPAIVQIFKKTGTKRCMWGSDYPVSSWAGKVVSLADGFCWLYDGEYRKLPDAPEPWTIGMETMMAIRQACILEALSEDQIEDIFYNNAAGLFAHETGTGGSRNGSDKSSGSAQVSDAAQTLCRRV